MNIQVLDLYFSGGQCDYCFPARKDISVLSAQNNERRQASRIDFSIRSKILPQTPELLIRQKSNLRVTLSATSGLWNRDGYFPKNGGLFWRSISARFAAGGDLFV